MGISRRPIRGEALFDCHVIYYHSYGPGKTRKYKSTAKRRIKPYVFQFEDSVDCYIPRLSIN